MTTAVFLLFLSAAPPQPEGAAVTFQKASQALSAGNLDAAEQGFLSVLKLEPNSIPALGNLGVTYSRMERYPDAVKTYQRALKLAPSHPGLLLNLAIAYVKQSDYEPAKPLLLRLPRNTQTRELLATCELFTGHSQQALSLLDGLPPNPEVLFLSGTARLHLKQPEAAKRDFAALLASASPAQAHLLMGKAYSDNAQFDEALVELKQALDLDPPSLPARLELAKAQIGLRENENAEQNLRAVLAANPSHPEAAYYLGALLVLLAREDESLPLLQQARAARPDAWGAYYYLGRAYMQKGQAPQALPFLQKSSTLNPNEAAVWFQLARAFSALSRRPEAAQARARYDALRSASLEKTQPIIR